MSDTEGTAGSDDEVTEFKCRKCPGKTFTAAEKDAHRMFHREQKEKDKKKKAGPKSKTRRSGRDTSPAQSVATLFEAVPNDDSPPPSNKRGRRRKADTKAAAPKRKSRKTYDQDAIGEWSRGNGA